MLTSTMATRYAVLPDCALQRIVTVSELYVCAIMAELEQPQFVKGLLVASSSYQTQGDAIRQTALLTVVQYRSNNKTSSAYLSRMQLQQWIVEDRS